MAVTRLASQAVRLGYYMGYAVPGQSPLELVEAAREAEALGYDSAWAAEAWGTDAVTPLAWLGALTTGSSSARRSCRSPAARPRTRR